MKVLNLEDFLAFCTEREHIRIAREAGMPEPWTDDPVLRKAFFCNVYREDDKVTRWFRQHVRDRHRPNPRASLITTTLFRWFNKIDTGEFLMPWFVMKDIKPFDLAEMQTRLEARRDAGHTIFGAAYIISSPLGDPKIQWALNCTRQVVEQADEILTHFDTLQSAHKRLTQCQGLGAFMAYEIVTDLRHTAALEHAPDKMTWCAPGPGCARGLGWLLFNTNKVFSRGNREDLRDMLKIMNDLLPIINDRWHWKDRPWEMRELEHTLCEYDKFRRVQNGDRPKRWFR